MSENKLFVNVIVIVIWGLDCSLQSLRCLAEVMSCDERTDPVTCCIREARNKGNTTKTPICPDYYTADSNLLRNMLFVTTQNITFPANNEGQGEMWEVEPLVLSLFIMQEVSQRAHATACSTVQGISHPDWLVSSQHVVMFKSITPKGQFAILLRLSRNLPSHWHESETNTTMTITWQTHGWLDAKKGPLLWCCFQIWQPALIARMCSPKTAPLIRLWFLLFTHF